MHVKLDPKALASRQIGIDEVSNAIQNGNVNLPTGILYGTHQAFTVQVNGQLTKAADYRPARSWPTAMALPFACRTWEK